MDVVIPNFPQVFGGNPVGLETCIGVAAYHGNTVHVIEPDGFPEKEEFARIYKHSSPNPAGFEMACFHQWFIIKKWMTENNKSVVFKIDSDVLVFESLDTVAALLPEKYFCTIPVPTSFVTIEGIEAICRLIMEAFRNGLAEEVCKPNHVADNTMLAPQADVWQAPNFITGHRPLMIDPNITQPCGGLLYERHRDIFFVAGKPYFFDGPETVRLLTIHCWGKAKLHMPNIWEQAKLSKRLEYPVRLVY